MKSLTEINNQLGDYVRFNEYVKYKLQGKITYTARKREMNYHLNYFIDFVEKTTHKIILTMSQQSINNDFDNYVDMREKNKDKIKVRRKKILGLKEKAKAKIKRDI